MKWHRNCPGNNEVSLSFAKNFLTISCYHKTRNWLNKSRATDTHTMLLKNHRITAQLKEETQTQRLSSKPILCVFCTYHISVLRRPNTRISYSYMFSATPSFTNAMTSYLNSKIISTFSGKRFLMILNAYNHVFTKLKKLIFETGFDELLY